MTRDLSLRAQLLQLADEEHVLLLTQHHIASDGWSQQVLWRELATLYQAYHRGESSPLPELPCQYVDYADWQREWLQGERLQSELDYWREQLAGLERLELPSDRPRPPRLSYRGGRQAVRLEAELVRGLRELSRAAGATLQMTLLAAFQVLLHRYSGQDDVAVGVPTAGRVRPELEPLIGFFVNTLVLRGDLSGEPTFRELLTRVRETSLSAYDHQEVPFEQLVEALQPERQLNRNPLVQVLFQLLQFPPQPQSLGAVQVARSPDACARTHVDLELHLRECRDAIEGRFVYSSELFDTSTIERMVGHYLTLLGGIVADPDRSIGELPLLTEAEQRQLLVEWNNTAADYPRDKCVHQLFEEQVARTPHAAAVEFAGEQLTYRELNRWANQLAHQLRGQGVGPEVRVGVCLERSLEMLAGLLGILKSGGAYVPLDPSYPRDRLAWMLDDAGVEVLLTQEALLDRLAFRTPQVICLDRDARRLAAESGRDLAPGASTENLAYVIYTSGSTGRPKGVAMPHRALVNLLRWQLAQSRRGEGSRTLQYASLSFDVSFQEIFATWCAGGTLVLIGEAARRDPEQLWQVIVKQTVQRLFLPFVALQMLAEGLRDAFSEGCRLQEVITAGEQLQVTPAIRRLFASLPECVLVNQYGPTESHVVTAYSLAGDPQDWPDLPPIGRPITNAEIYLLDRHRQPVPVGIPGKLYIGGVCLARGYLGQPELTAERFVAPPWRAEAGTRLYATGDLARYLPDGHLQFLGRSDQQVKIRGYRVELGEIEAVLRQHPCVQEAVVLAREDHPGNRRLVAYIVAESGVTTLTAELREFLRDRLPDYMLPAAFVGLGSLPLTPSGKVDRRALPAPEEDRPELAVAYVPPRDAVEEQLAAIWGQVLGLERVGIHDSFFELGGHSLLAMQVLSRVNRACQVDLPLRVMFESPTVADLARVVKDSCESGGKPSPARIGRVSREAHRRK